MSKITNQDTEPSVTCGFYNGANRYYDAVQLSSIFDGIIRDGIFASIGDCFVVTCNGDSNNVYVGTGKCWFNHTWTQNDAVLRVTCPDAPGIMGSDRIDAIVIEVNSVESVCDNFIKVVKGSESATPSRPTMTRENGVYQYALCYIYRKANSSVITQADITDVRGYHETPFITGILDVLNAEQLFIQWRGELDNFVDKEKQDLIKFQENQENDFSSWYNSMTENMESVIADSVNWTDSQKATFIEWFNAMKGQLSTDAAGNIQVQIDKHEVEYILSNGFPACTKTISDDGLVISSVEPDGSLGRTLTKTFSSDFSSCTAVLYSKSGSEIGRLVKTFSSDGSTISSEITII